MIFEWDEAKSEATYQLRGFDFAYAALVFDDPHRIERLDDRKDYGEPRWQTFGQIEDRVFMVAYTPRASAIRTFLPAGRTTVRKPLIMPAKPKTKPITKADGSRVRPRLNPALIDKPAARKPDANTPKLTMRQLKELAPPGPPAIDVAKLRARLKMSQPVFAHKFGLSVGTLRDWEQGRRAPQGATRVLLSIIDREPKAVLRALNEA